MKGIIGAIIGSSIGLSYEIKKTKDYNFNMIYDALGYYKILEVDVLADDKTIKIKYRDKAKQWHPDHNESENALEIFQKISVAYDILKDNKTRTMYDMLSMVYTQKEFPDFLSHFLHH